MDKLLKLKINFLSAFSIRSFISLLGRYPSRSPPTVSSIQRDCRVNLLAPTLDRGSPSLVPRGLQVVRASGTYADGKGAEYINSGIDDGKEEDKLQLPVDPPNKPRVGFPSWVRWLIGSILTLVLPFLKFASGPKIKQIEGEVEMAMEGVEKAAEVVEKVATVAEKISEEVAESIPSDESKLKEAAVWVEKASKATAQDARLTQDIIHKVDVLEHDVGDLETIVEPIIEKIIEGGSKQKQ